MSLVHCLCFMLLLTICTAIRCIDQIQVQLSVSDIVSTDMETLFRDLKASSNMKCQVYMEFDSIAQQFTIKFGQLLEFPRLRSVENTYIHVTTSMISANTKQDVNGTSIKTTSYFLCYSNDGCDRQLVLEHVSWLLTTNYRNLESTIHPLLLVQGDKKNECTIGNGNAVHPCYNTACSWYHLMDTEEGEGKCENAYSPTLPMFELTTEIRMFEKLWKHEEKETRPIRAVFKHRSSMKFWCELNNCNNQKVTDLIKEAVRKEKDLWATVNIHSTDRK